MINPSYERVYSRSYPYGVDIVRHRGYWRIPILCQDFNAISQIVIKILNCKYDLEPLLYEDKLYIAGIGYSQSQGKALYETIKKLRKQN